VLRQKWYLAPHTIIIVIVAVSLTKQLAIPLAIFDRDVRPPKSMDLLSQLANGIRVLNQDVCLSTEGGAVPNDPRLP
jgi:hypothetical protein